MRLPPVCWYCFILEGLVDYLWDHLGPMCFVWRARSWKLGTGNCVGIARLKDQLDEGEDTIDDEYEEYKGGRQEDDYTASHISEG